MERAVSARSSQGFGLVEILVTLVIITFGIIAHMTFQRVTYHAAGLFTARARAAEIAQEKLEDLRSFGCLKTGDCSFAYQDIGNDTGGMKNSAGQLIQSATKQVTVDNTTFNRHWNVINDWFPAANSAVTTTAPKTTPTPLPNLKQVTVTVTWADSNNNSQTLKMSTLIAGANPAAQSRVYQ